MKHIKKYHDYIFEFVENKSNTINLYKDDKLEVKVVKTLDSCKEQGKDTMWCSNVKSGFYKHNMTANMYRINFSDGYKLRLTWDYITQGASMDKSGGTHWGSGGILYNNKISYYYIRPKDDSKPFEFDYNKGDHRQKMVDYINSIPSDVIKLVHNYQDKSINGKNAILNSLYKEIQLINVISVVVEEEKYKIKIKYRGNYYNIEYGYFIEFGDDFKKDFKNKYAFYDPYETLDKYILDKVREFQKSKINESNNLG